MFTFILFFISFVILWKSADIFVDASHSLALHLKLPPIVIGATVVAFGTSAPELFVNFFAAFESESSIVYGNILGSNIANSLLILGVATCLTRLFITTDFKEQVRFNLLITIIVSICLYFGFVNRWVAILFLSLFLMFNIFMFQTKFNSSVSDDPVYSFFKSLGLFLIGLILLILSARCLIYSVVEISVILGVSSIFISLFAVALGTSLPELISTVMFIKKGHSDMVIGNVFGSNIFNFIFVLPVSWLVFPLNMPHSLVFELVLLNILFVFIFILSLFKQFFYRYFGGLLLLMYTFYIFFIYFRQ